MKTILKFTLLYLSLVLIVTSCSSNSDERTALVNSLEAAIDVSCVNTINYQDDHDNVYAYRADDIFNSASIQAGGHSTGNDNPDLGVNVFGDDPVFGLPETSTYTVDSGSGLPGTAYVFYIDELGEQYISTDNNIGKLIHLDLLTILADGTVTELKASFNEIEVRSISFVDDTLCVNAFQLSVNNN